MEKEKVVIIGSGPAACTAAIYCARAALDPVMIMGYEAGGQLTTTPEVGNWPGMLGSPSGFDIMDKVLKHTEEFNVRKIYDVVQSVDFSAPEGKKIKLSGDRELSASAVIIATGARARYLNLPNEAKFKGKGISACATCDGMFFRNKTVAVIGGGSVAFIEALFLSRLCTKIYLIHRREGFRAEQVLVERINELVAQGKVELLLKATVDDYVGDEVLQGLKLTVDGEKRELKLDGAFVAIGHQPATEIFAGHLDCDDHGYIQLGKSGLGDSATSCAGVFAAGDCAHPSYHQAIVASGEGCKAALDTEQYLLGLK